MVWHFDHRFNGYEKSSQDTRELNSTEHNNPEIYPLPRYWVHESYLQDRLKRIKTVYTAFRDITNSTNARTAIFSIIPAMLCGDTLHVISLDSQNIGEELYFASCTSSFIFDYITRQKLGGTHLKYFLVKQLAVLPPERYTAICQWDTRASVGAWICPRALELSYTAWDLEPFAKNCGYDGPPFRWDEERRFLLRCELDAAYFHLYGIARDDVDYIMDTFPIVKRKEEEKYEEYRTKRVSLEIYDEMQKAIESGEPYQTRLDPVPADAAVAHAGRGGVEV
jgi:hypothetical protein